MSLGKHTEAIVQFNKAIELDSSNEYAWLNKAMTEERLGLKGEALTSYQKFVELKPTQFAAHLDHAKTRIEELKKGRK
jgi:tetratricopeptide (TPR) repeat protein